MPVIAYNLAALSIAALYYSWRDVYHVRLLRERVLRERVAYLLWTAAQYAA
jgi:hypothetical protein